MRGMTGYQNFEKTQVSAGIILVFSSLIMLTALGFQHIAGHAPCTLCYYERFAYYFAIPASVIALMSWQIGKPRLARAILAVIALAFLANTCLAIYHAGAEWKFWPGPQFCGVTSTLNSTTGDLFSQKIVKCDEASGRFLGLSFAGYNVIASFVLALVALFPYRK